jgi:N utilization substance protein B
MAAGGRRRARERALGILYEAEVKAVPPGSVVANLAVPPDPYVADLVSGVATHAEAVDALISRFSVDWPLERMPAVDRNLLRIAVFELLRRQDVPVAAVISEAVELAKAYSTERSASFLNGVLGSVAAQVRHPPVAPGAPPEGSTSSGAGSSPGPRASAAAEGAMSAEVPERGGSMHP